MPAHITKNLTSLSAASPILEIPFLQTGFILNTHQVRANTIIPSTTNLFESLFDMTKQHKDSTLAENKILQNLAKYGLLYRQAFQRESHSNSVPILWQPHTKLLDKINAQLK